MKIKEFALHRYGPLKDTGRVTPGAFTLFFGENEEGKTLTIDALIKLLLGKKIGLFKDEIDRVEEKPDGYVVLEKQDGQEIKLPEHGTLPEVAGISAEECRNLFIIRNSELSIANEAQFYTNITDRLTGLRSEQIQKVIQKLRQLGRLTPSGVLADSKEMEHIKGRLQKAREIQEDARKLLEEARKQGWDELEAAIVETEEKLEELRRVRHQQEVARRYWQFKNGSAWLEQLQETEKMLERFREIDDSVLTRWLQLQHSLQEKEEEITALRKKLAANDTKWEELRKEFLEADLRYKNLKERKENFDSRIRPLLINFHNQETEVNQNLAKRKFYLAVSGISLLILLLSLAGLILSFRALFQALAAVSAVLLIISLFRYFAGIVKKQADLRRLETEIVHQAGDLGFSAATVAELQAEASGFLNSFAELEDYHQRLQAEAEAYQKEIRELREHTLPEYEEKRRKLNEQLQQLQVSTGSDTLEDLRRMLAEKKKWEQRFQEAYNSLKATFGLPAEKNIAEISYWQEKVARARPEPLPDEPLAFDETAVGRLDAAIAETETRVNEMRQQFARFQERLREIERTVNENIYPRGGEHLFCHTIRDLESVLGILKEFETDVTRRAELALEAIEIFQEIEAEEQQRVVELFGEQSGISRIFSEITGGLYIRVAYDQVQKKIRILRKDEVWLEARQLSGGAYDQLYIAIRLALGEKLIADGSGFFIFDDPFLKSDSYRLRNQMAILKHIVKQGWQVLYFSAKEEVLVALEKDIDNKTVVLERMPGTVFK